MTILALHGFTEDDTVWPAVLATAGIAARGVLLPGHGWKPCPDSVGAASLAADLARRLPAHGGAVLGYSLGARLALRLAVDHPQVVRRLILVSGTAGIADADRRAAREADDLRLADSLDSDGLGPFIARWEDLPALRPSCPLPASRAGAMRALRIGHDPHGLSACLRRLGQGACEPLWDRLATITCPVLLIHGADDLAYAAAAAAMAAAMPSATVVSLATCGHAPHREQPAAMCAAIATWLADWHPLGVR